MYSNSASSLSRSFYTASGFCPSHSTTLRSKMRGIKPLTASSQAVFPGHAPSIYPPGCTVICLGFRLDELLSAATSSLSFLFCRLVALAAISMFPVRGARGSICAFGGQKGPGYGIDPRAGCIIHDTCDNMDPTASGIIHGTWDACSC
jgi:hypothetical protein